MKKKQILFLPGQEGSVRDFLCVTRRPLLRDTVLAGKQKQCRKREVKDKKSSGDENGFSASKQRKLFAQFIFSQQDHGEKEHNCGKNYTT